MAFVFSLWDMGLWLAASSIIMLVTAELLSPYFGRININIDIKRLKNSCDSLWYGIPGHWQQQDLYIWLNNTVSGLLTLDSIFDHICFCYQTV